MPNQFITATLWSAGLVLLGTLLLYFRNSHRVLRASEQRYRILYHNNPALCFTLDRLENIHGINSFGASQLGYSEADLAGKSLQNILYAPDLAVIRQHIEACTLNYPQICHAQFRGVHKDGHIIWLESCSRAEKELTGFVIYLVCQDITSRKQSEQSAITRENHFRAMVDTAPALIWVADADRLCTYFNNAWLTFTGRTLQEELGKGWMEGVHPDDLKHCLETYHTAFATRQTFNIEYRLRRADSTYRLILDTGNPRYETDGSFVGYIGSCIDITAWRQIEESRRATETQLLKVLETISEAVLTVDQDQRIILFNHYAEKIFGYSASEVMGQSLDILLPERLIETHQAHIRNFAADSAEIRPVYEQKIKITGWRKDGTEFPIEASVSKLTHLGRVTFTAMIQDVTDSHKMRESLNHKNEALRMLHEVSLEIVNHLDLLDLLKAIVIRSGLLVGTPHGFIYMVLPEENCLEMKIGTEIYTRFIGYRLKYGEGLSGSVWSSGKPVMVNDYPHWDSQSDVFPTDLFQAVMGVPLRSAAGIVGVLGLAQLEPGKIFTEDQIKLLSRFAELASIALDNAHLYEAVRRQVEELEQRVIERTRELNDQKREVETILENAADSVIFTDLAGNILYVNPAWEKLTGYTIDFVRQRNPRLIQSGETSSRVYSQMWQTIMAGYPWHGYVKNKRKDGELYDAELTVAPVKDEEGNIYRFVGVQRDVTNARQLEAQKNRFVANAAHDLRTPLTSLKLRLYLLRQHPEDFDTHMRILEQTNQHIAYLVSDLLDLTRFEQGVIPFQPRKLDLKASIDRVIEMVQPLADNKHINLFISLPSDPGDQPLSLLADPVRIQQMVTNLLANAIHYTDDGGNVQIIIQREFESPIQQWAVVHIQDDGIGISANHLPNIFEPFYRINEQKVGTGLGLSIVREIVEWHGGKISAISVPGHGTRFTIMLPVANDLKAVGT